MTPAALPQEAQVSPVPRMEGTAGWSMWLGVLRGPLEQPLFLLGAAFVLVVFFAPGGLTGRFGGGTRREEA